MIKNIWITGSKGMLGSAIANKLKNDYHLLLTDKECDITDYNVINNCYTNNKSDLIINCAAYTDVDKAETEEKIAYAVNAAGPKNLGILSAKYKIPIIHFSTDYIFDGTKKTPYQETDKPNPLQVYGKSKLLGEQYLIDSTELFYIIRTSWLYGKNGTNFVSKILQLLKDKKQIRVIDNQFGTPTYTNDLAAAIEKVLKSDLNYGIYNFTNAGSTNWYMFAKEIYNISKKFGLVKRNVEIISVNTKDYKMSAQRPLNSVLSTQKIKNKLQIDIPIWKSSVKKYLHSLFFN